LIMMHFLVVQFRNALTQKKGFRQISIAKDPVNFLQIRMVLDTVLSMA
jgi:hypothetical protein